MNKKIIFQPDAGLGNRLNCIYSGIYYSRYYKSPLHILWLKENCCNVGFSELFETPENCDIKTIYHLGYKNKYAIKSIATLLYMRILKKTVKYMDAGETRHFYEREGEKGIHKMIADYPKICFMSSGIICTDENVSEVRNGLTPVKEIKDRVSEIMDPYKDRNVIGIHIRRTDHEVAIANSPLEGFISICDSQPDGTVFYLATDDEEVEKQFASRYELIPHKRFANSINRNSSEGMKDAYVDMLCLSKTKKIYGSCGSTFSMMGAFIGNIELTVVGK